MRSSIPADASSRTFDDFYHLSDSKGTARTVNGEDGSTLMEAVIRNKIPEIIAECGGSCDIYVDDVFVAMLGKASGIEEELLDNAHKVKANSRLSCQIKLAPALDGLMVATPDRQG